MSYLRFWPIFSVSARPRIGREGVQNGRFVESGAADRPAHRQVISGAGVPAKRQADKIRAKRVDRSGLGIEAKPGLRREFGDERREFLGSVDGEVLGDPLRGRFLRVGAEFLHKAMKSALDAECLERFNVGRRDFEGVPIEFQRDVGL